MSKDKPWSKPKITSKPSPGRPLPPPPKPTDKLKGK